MVPYKGLAVRRSRSMSSSGRNLWRSPRRPWRSRTAGRLSEPRAGPRRFTVIRTARTSTCRWSDAATSTTAGG